MHTKKLLSVLTLSLAAGAYMMPAAASDHGNGDHQGRHESSRPPGSYQHGKDAHRDHRQTHAAYKHQSHNYSRHANYMHNHSVYQALPQRVIYVVPGMAWGISIHW